MMLLLNSRLSRTLAATALAAALTAPAWSVMPAAAQTVPTATPASASSIVVATFNVRCANCSKKPVNSREKRWETRAPVIVEQILREKVDVVAVQEASPGLLDDRKTAQFEDLVNRLGAPYAVTNPARYNCEKSTTFTKCVKKDQEASQDARIIYNTNRLTLRGFGSIALDSRKVGNGSARHMTWAKFSAPSGKQFIFATAHFEPGTSKSKTKTRVKQVKKATAELVKVNPGKLPVIWGSDLASSKLTHSGNKSYDAFIAAGFKDPLGNKYKAKDFPKGSLLNRSNSINEEFFTLNNFAKAPKSYLSRGYKIGAHLDYVLVQGKVKVTSWEQVLNLTASGKFAGVIPSDHNMVKATAVLS